MAATVWLFDSRVCAAADVAACEAWLGPSERQRLAGFVRLARRRQFVLGRALLRAALAPLLVLKPQDIPLVERPGNAPLLDLPRDLLPGFSLSHSGPWIACAVSADAPVGLDIECLNAERDLMALAEHVFDDAQQAVLAGLPSDVRVRQFYQMWSKAEARFKLGMPIAHETVLAHPALSIVLCSAQPLAQPPALRDGAALLHK